MSRRLRFAVVAVPALIGVAWIALAVTSRVAFAQTHSGGMERPNGPPPKGDVVLIACDGSGSFGITAYQGSPGTPAKKSASCAENLSLLMKDGFIVRDVGQNWAEKTGLVIYTLVR